MLTPYGTHRTVAFISDEQRKANRRKESSRYFVSQYL